MYLIDNANTPLARLFELGNRNTIQQGYCGNVYEFYKAEHLLIVSLDGVEVGHLEHSTVDLRQVFHDWEQQTEKHFAYLSELDKYILKLKGGF